jgi:hypothetical protein
MNLTNVSALSINTTIEFLPEKMAQIQEMRFKIDALNITLDNRIQIVASLLRDNESKQGHSEVSPLLENLMEKMNELRGKKKDAYCW